MIAVIQRVSESFVTVNGKEVSHIKNGLVILLGVVNSDNAEDANILADKISNFRIFNDKNKKMNLSIKDTDGEILVISQFTLCADWLKGRRPSFIKAAEPKKGKLLYEKFVENLNSKGIATKSGIFGAMMDVSLVNSGPVTFVLDSSLKI